MVTHPVQPIPDTGVSRLYSAASGLFIALVIQIPAVTAMGGSGGGVGPWYGGIRWRISILIWRLSGSGERYSAIP